MDRDRSLDRCIEDLKNDKWVLPALKQIREICMLYSEAPPNVNHSRRSRHKFYRHEVINRLQQHHSLVILVADNLTAYMNRAHVMAKEHPELDPNSVSPDNRYSHVQQVQERLNFLRFLLKDGQLWLCAPQAEQIWTCLAENAVYVTDREACFKWFSKLMGEEPDLDPEIHRDFFENIVLQLDPSLLTESGIKCFDRFFKAVNSEESKLLRKGRTFLMNDLELLGLDYLWRVILCSSEDVANRAIELLKQTYTNLGPQLQPNQMDIHEDFVQLCMDRLKAAFDTISVLERDKDSVNRVQQETTRMVRVLKVLREYVVQCDGDYGEERSILPMARAQRGKQLSFTIRFSNRGRSFDDTEVWTHANGTLGSVRRQILTRVKANNVNMKVDLFVNGELLDPADDEKRVSQLPLRDKMIISAKLCQVGTNMPSSPDSSSDSSTGSPQHPFDDPNIEVENSLPGVLMAQQQEYAQFLFQLADLGSSLNVPALCDEAHAVLKLIPPGYARLMPPVSETDLLSEHFKELFINENCWDTVLQVEDKEFKVHRAILSARSSFFSAMFLHDTSEKQTGIVKIPDCDPDCFKVFLEYLYSGKFKNISSENAAQLYVISDKYDVQELKTFCRKYLMQNITLQNFSEVLILADVHDEINFLSAIQYFFNKHFKEIVTTSEWEKLLKCNFRLANKLLIGKSKTE